MRRACPEALCEQDTGSTIVRDSARQCKIVQDSARQCKTVQDSARQRHCVSRTRGARGTHQAGQTRISGQETGHGRKEMRDMRLRGLGGKTGQR